MKKFILLEHHPNDSRIRLQDDGICQSLTSRMGTGGGNVPIVIEVKDEEATNHSGIKSESCNDNE